MTKKIVNNSKKNKFDGFKLSKNYGKFIELTKKYKKEFEKLQKTLIHKKEGNIEIYISRTNVIKSLKINNIEQEKLKEVINLVLDKNKELGKQSSNEMMNEIKSLIH